MLYLLANCVVVTAISIKLHYSLKQQDSKYFLDGFLHRPTAKCVNIASVTDMIAHRLRSLSLKEWFHALFLVSSNK